jgi:hypothetical protein
VLRFAYDYDCESLLGTELLQEARQTALPDLKALQARYLQNTTPPDIPIRQHSIDEYDQLLSGEWKTQEVACG